MSGDWRHPAYTIKLGHQLVDPSLIPTIWTRTTALQQDGVLLKKRGTQVQRTGERIHERWQKLAPHYRAPEGAQLLAGTTRPKTKAETAGRHLVQASELLWHFAAELQPLAQRLNGLRGEAQPFASWAMRYPADWTRLAYPSGVPGQPLGLAENDRIADAVGGVLGQIRALEQRYAQAIRNLVDTSVLPDLPLDPNTRRADRERANVAHPGDSWRGADLGAYGLPWGGLQPVTNPSGIARVMRGLVEGVVEAGLFFPKLVGVDVQIDWSGTRRDPTDVVTGGSVAKAAWIGVVKVGMLGIPATYAIPALRRENVATAKALGEGFIASDEKDPYVQGGKIGANVLTLFTPSPLKGPAGALARVGDDLIAKGSLGGRVAGKLAKLPDFFTSGKLLGADVRLGKEALQAGLPKVGDLVRAAEAKGVPGAGRLAHALDQHQAGRNVEAIGRLRWGLGHMLERYGEDVEAMHQRRTDLHDAAANSLPRQQQILDDAKLKAEGKPAAERTRIFQEALERIREIGARQAEESDAIKRAFSRQEEALHDRALRRALRTLRDLDSPARLAAVRDVWEELPEPVRDLIAVWEQSPGSLAANLPEEFLQGLGVPNPKQVEAAGIPAGLAGLDPEVRRDLAGFLAFLRDHPEFVAALDQAERAGR
jgi:hypothetical protein